MSLLILIKFKLFFFSQFSWYQSFYFWTDLWTTLFSDQSIQDTDINDANYQSNGNIPPDYGYDGALSPLAPHSQSQGLQQQHLSPLTWHSHVSGDISEQGWELPPYQARPYPTTGPNGYSSSHSLSVMTEPGTPYPEFYSSSNPNNSHESRINLLQHSSEHTQVEPFQTPQFPPPSLPPPPGTLDQIPPQPTVDTCYICSKSISSQYPTSKDAFIRVLACNHVCHEGCFASWVDMNHNHCPVCMQVVISLG